MTQIILPVIDLSNKTVSQKSFEIPFSLEVQSARSIAYVVRWQLARRRSGSAKTKTMAEISGTTAKPYKQKGTGNARQGSKRSVQFVGGRTCHGPMPRSFDFALPKKISALALADAIKTKLKDGKVAVLSGSSNKTSAFCQSIEKQSVGSALVITNKTDNIYRAVRNIKNFKAASLDSVNVYDILRFDHLLVESEIFSNKILKIAANG